MIAALGSSDIQAFSWDVRHYKKSYLVTTPSVSLLSPWLALASVSYLALTL